jgi:hypothetical protein
MSGMASCTRASNDETAPLRGEVVTLRFDGRQVVVLWGPDGGDNSIGRFTLDFEPAQGWLRGQRTTLDPSSALDLWNFQWDVAASLTGAWPVLGRVLFGL